MRRNRKLAMLLPCLLLCLHICGCSQPRQVENQAYVLVMGMDRTANGEIEINVLCPKIAGSSAEAATAGGQGSQGNYLQISVTAANYESALEKLNWAVPRSLNLAQIKMIVLSRDLVENMNTKKLLEEVARTERLFTAAQVVVCNGNAGEFLSEMQPSIGTRLSTDIDGVLEHYIRQGMIPESTLADLFYLSQSIYSDSMAAYALLHPESREEKPVQQEAKEASALMGTPESISESRKSDIRTRYLGSVLFSEGEFRGILNGDQTILANLLNNSLESFRYTCNGECLEFSPVGKTRVNVDTHSQPAKINIKIELAVSNQASELDVGNLAEIFRRDIYSLIGTTQRLEVEPFGFAEAAAKHFLTISSWIEYNWMDKFKDADVDIDVNFQHLNA